MNVSIRLFVLSFLLAAPLYAQTDSLEARLAQVSGREKVEVLVALVQAHRSNDLEQAIAYGREALALLRTYPDAGLEANVWFQKGSAHYGVSQYDSALVHAERLREIAQATGNTRGLADAASLRGRVHRRQGHYEQALTFYRRALGHFVDLGDPSGTANALDDIGHVHRNLGDYDQALDFHLRALQIKEERGDQRGVSITLNNIGHVHRNLGNDDQALTFYRRSLEISEEIGDPSGVAIALNSTGAIYQKRGNYPQALAATQRAIAVAEEIEKQDLIRDGYQTLAGIYEGQGQFEDALVAYKRYQAADDSLFNSESQAAIAERQTQYRTREQQQQIERLRRLIQRFWLGGLVGGLVLLGLVAFLFYSRHRLKNRANRALEKVNNMLKESMRLLTEAQDRLIDSEKMASLGAMTAGIAQEIKKSLNFVNNFARLSVELADELADELDQNADKTVGDIREEIDELLTDLKHNMRKIDEHSQRADAIVQNMMLHANVQPAERRLTDLNALLDDDVNLAYHGMRTQQPDFTVTLERDYDEALGPVEVVPQEMGRVFLNLLNNAFDAVHQKALAEEETYTPRVTVLTYKGADHVVIRVGDNGAGVPAKIHDKIFEPFFTTKQAGSGTGLGLSLSHEIVTQGHGGTLTVESEEGEGATFVVTLPIH